MSKVQIPGAAWVIMLAIVNTLPAALNDAFPGAIWVPLVVDLLLVAGKAIQVYRPKQEVIKASDVFGGPKFVSAMAPDSLPSEESKVKQFFLG